MRNSVRTISPPLLASATIASAPSARACAAARRPSLRRQPLHACIGQHDRAPRAAFAIRTRRHDPARIGCSADACGRIDRHDHLVERRRLRDADCVQLGAPPKRAFRILDHFPAKLLALINSAAVALAQRCGEIWREVLRILPRRCARDRHVVAHQQLFQHRARSRRRRQHQQRALAKSQRKRQRLQHHLGLCPIGHLVAPGRIELRAAQALGIFRREAISFRAVGPDQPSPRRLVARPHGAARAHARRPVDQHLAHVMQCRRNQREAPEPSRARAFVHPFRARARLARAARARP
jgi:hypothetical protein